MHLTWDTQTPLPLHKNCGKPMLWWAAIQRHTRSTSVINFLSFHPSLTNPFTPEYHITPFWNCQIHTEVIKTELETAQDTWRGQNPSGVYVDGKSLSSHSGCLHSASVSWCPESLFCNNKDHVRGKSHGRTTTLSLASGPFLMENTACALLASHRAWSNPCTANIKWQRLHELCQHSCYQALSTRPAFRFS